MLFCSSSSQSGAKGLVSGSSSTLQGMAMAAEFLVEVGGVTEAVRLSGACMSISSGSGTSAGSTDDSGVAMKARKL
ncbi:hypothetical protein MTO96_022011 [Rhipicephalus appendiculatus]